MSNGGLENHSGGTARAGEQEQTEETKDWENLKTSIPTKSGCIATESFLLVHPASSAAAATVYRAHFEARFSVPCLKYIPPVAAWAKEGFPWATRLGFVHLVGFVGLLASPT